MDSRKKSRVVRAALAGLRVISRRELRRSEKPLPVPQSIVWQEYDARQNKQAS